MTDAWATVFSFPLGSFVSVVTFWRSRTLLHLIDEMSYQPRYIFDTMSKTMFLTTCQILFAPHWSQNWTYRYRGEKLEAARV